MTDNSKPNIKSLTPKELKEVQDLFKEKSIDVQIRFNPQKVTRMEDGGLVISPPSFQTGFVKVVKTSNGSPGSDTKLEVN